MSKKTERPKSFDDVKPKAVAKAPRRFEAGDRVTYKARTHEGRGKFIAYEASQKGEWVLINSDTHGEIRLRPSQAKRI